ncbi:BspA family leucine-rich repeat surface protein [Mycoplasma mycoides]|uniref:BspA family leucine-rich repeat surface protein n=1 Tax=Mycoplasma mycoides TaxID=2102 RepID=UPI00223FC31C|nr:BspA family leucine-rich repeat surface protein [Mycoplasma mycoides]QVK09503.1 BspA family leucine-rich repeat surface protein [Mycoplasma mycoides subsp. capri]
MKRLLTILTSSSTVFLLSAGVFIVNRNNIQNNFYFNKKKPIARPHKIENGVLKEVGYYLQGNRVRVHTISFQVHTIDADLPEEVNSLRSAFVGNNNNVIWKRKWDTSNITDMNSTFYGTKWFNSDAVKEWDVSNVTDMGEMFAYTGSFDQDLSKWDVSNVKNFEKMFEGSKEYNNNEQPLEWGDKLKNADNMQGMFDKAEKFSHSLSDWKPDKYVVNKNFGLDINKQPKWKTEPPKISIPTKPNSESIPDQRDNNSSSSIVSPKNNENSQSTPGVTTPIHIEKDNMDVEKLTIPKNDLPKTPNIDNETIKIDNNEDNKTNIQDKSNNKNGIYKFPSYRPNTLIKSNLSNTGVIAGTVLGTFFLLGIGVGTGYYYRKNLKNLYFKSKEKIKDKLSKINSKK